MSKPKIKTIPDFASDSEKHIEAIKLGNEQFSLWERNVSDNFKSLSVEEIREELSKTANKFAICFEHWIGDFNMGTGIRNANGFNAKEVFYLGEKKWDRRSAVGVHNYTPVKFLHSIDELLALKNEYVFVGIDNVPGSVPLESYQWAPNSLMIFGEEGCGLTPTIQSFCKDIVSITMYGSVRSFNCGVASGIVMYDYITKTSKMPAI